MMKGDVTLIFLIFTQAVVFAAAWFGPGMKDLADRADHDHGKRRLRKELCDELDRHWMDEVSRSEFEKLRRLSDDLALKSLSDILDRVEKRVTGEADNIIRRLMKNLNLPDPPMYKLLDGRYSASAAERTCKDLGGQLAVIRHGIDQSLAWEASSKASYGKVFIGLMRRGSRIYWRDGSKLTFYTFKDGFRMRYNRYTSYCGVIDRKKGTWSFASCYGKRPALCQFKRNSTPRAPPQKYMLLNGLFRAAAAAKTCHAVGGRLAIIRHGTDQSLAQRISRRSTTYNIFIGMVRDRRDLKWRDGSRVTYRNFRSPRYSRYGSCGVLERGSGVWKFMSCQTQLEALCEFPVNSTSRPPIPGRVTAKTPSRTSGKFPLRRTTPKLPDKRTGKTPSRTTPSRGKFPPRRTTTKPRSRSFFDTDLRFMFEYEVSRRDRRFTADLITAIGKLLRKETRDISVLSMRPGSTIVRVRIYLNANEDAEMIEATLHREAKMGGVLDMKFYGRLRPIVDPFPDPMPKVGHSKPALKIIIPVVVLVIVLIACAIVAVVFLLKKRRNVRPAIAAPVPVPEEPEPLPTYKEFTANDYTKPPDEPNAPPAYDDVAKPAIA